MRITNGVPRFQGQKFRYPRVCPGDQPLTKSRGNSGLEIGVLIIRISPPRHQFPHLRGQPLSQIRLKTSLTSYQAGLTGIRRPFVSIPHPTAFTFLLNFCAKYGRRLEFLRCYRTLEEQVLVMMISVLKERQSSSLRCQAAVCE